MKFTLFIALIKLDIILYICFCCLSPRWIISSRREGSCLSFVFQYRLTITLLLPILPITLCSITCSISGLSCGLLSSQVCRSARRPCLQAVVFGVVFPMAKFCRSSSRSCSCHSPSRTCFSYGNVGTTGQARLLRPMIRMGILSSTQHLSQTESWRLM